MMRENFLEEQVGFLSNLLDKVILKYPGTKRFIHNRLKNQIEKNKELEKNLEDPKEVLSNLMGEVSKSIDEKQKCKDT